MPEEELPACTSMSPEYALELRLRALEESVRRLEKQRLLAMNEAANEVEKRLARGLRIAMGLPAGVTPGGPKL